MGGTPIRWQDTGSHRGMPWAGPPALALAILLGESGLRRGTCMLGLRAKELGVNQLVFIACKSGQAAVSRPPPFSPYY